jgi:hypothetical protein
LLPQVKTLPFYVKNTVWFSPHATYFAELSSPKVLILYGKSFSSPFNPIPN